MDKAVSKIASQVINLWLLFVSLYFMITAVAITDFWERYPIYIPEFIMCIAFIVIALAVPITADILLYRFWYRRFGMSKLWVAIPLSVNYLLLIFCLIVFLVSIPEWSSFYLNA